MPKKTKYVRSTTTTSAIDDKGIPIPGTTYRLIKARRCTSKHLSHHCIGVNGHSGLHWCYNENGWYISWKGSRKIGRGGKFGIAASHCPYGHESYVKPEQRHDENHLHHSRWVKVQAKKGKRNAQKN
jgi:hypothetical protein